MKLPRGLTAAQRKHLAEVAAGCQRQSLIDEYAQALQLRDKCAAAIEKDGITQKTERGAVKLHPAHAALAAASNRMLKLRGLIEKHRTEQPLEAPRSRSSATEERIQRFLASGDEMELLLDNEGSEELDPNWREDPRVLARLQSTEKPQ